MPRLYGPYGRSRGRMRWVRAVTVATLLGAMIVGGALAAGAWVAGTLMAPVTAMTSSAQIKQVGETLRMASMTTQTPLYGSGPGSYNMVTFDPDLPSDAVVEAGFAPPEPLDLSADADTGATTSVFSLGGREFQLPDNTAVTIKDKDTILVHTPEAVHEVSFDTDSVGGWFLADAG